jgi:uncharacterized protein YceK
LSVDVFRWRASSALWIINMHRIILTSVICFVVALSGCATVAHVDNPNEPACHDALDAGLQSILAEQNEDAATATALAHETVETLTNTDLGPRPFTISSSSGTDYDFFVDDHDNACLLRLYGRERGFTSYTNNLTYISTRPLPGCRCSPLRD